MAQPSKRRLFIPRPREFWYLVWMLPPLIFMWSAAAIYRFTGNSINWMDFILPAGLIVSALLAHLLLVSAGSRADHSLLPCWTLILGIGLMFQYRLGVISSLTWMQPTAWIPVAGPMVLAVMAVLNGNNRFRLLSKLTWLWIISSVAVCVVVLVTGISYRGGTYGPGKTTPTELVKPLLILGLSGILAKYGTRITRGTDLFSADSRKVHMLVFASWLATGIFLVLLRDLGMLAATAALVIAMLTVTTGRKTYLFSGFALASAGAWLFQHFVTKGRVRFEAWLEPFSHPDSSGFQTIRSLFALFNGELLGQGIGNGYPSTIPLADTDFIYAAMAEEMGWVTTIMLLLLVWRLSRQALYHGSQSKEPFQALVCVGCGTVWMVQVMLHTGGVIKLIPMTGVPFPGLSVGGTALLIFSMLTGWIMAVSDANRRSKNPPS